MKSRKAKITISLCKETYGTYIKGQQLIYALWTNGHNAGLWELLPVGTSVETARAEAKEWADANNIEIISEKVF